MPRRAVDATLVYDGDCAFCTRCVEWLRPLHLARPRVVAWQHADLAALGLSREQCELELQWVTADRDRAGGADAVRQLLLASGGLWAALGVVLGVAPLRQLANAVYRVVAANRHRLPGGTPACALPAAERPGAS